MTTLRQKMIEDMQLHGFAERTQDSYLRAVRQLAVYFNKPPDQITEEELRQYFLYLKNVKKASRSTITLALCGIKFFYERTLQRQWTTLDLVRPPREKKLPVVLSVEEVRQVLARVRRWRYRVCLSTIYACGLRLQEGLHLQIGHIDGARQLLHVCHGKGGKDRYVPLPQPVLEMLRQYWAYPSRPGLDVSIVAPERQRPDECQWGAASVSRRIAGQWHPETSYRAYLAPLVCHPFIGSRAQPAHHPVLPGTRLAHHHCHLHPPDQPSEDLAIQAVNRRSWRDCGTRTGRYLSPVRSCLSPEVLRSNPAQSPPGHARHRAVPYRGPGRAGLRLPECGELQYSYHSCRNRHCPKCQNDKAQEWLEAQQDLLLPVPYFMLTFTLPAALNEIVRSNQSLLYNLLFRVSAGCHAAPGTRPALRWRPDRPGGYPAYLGTQPGLSPAHPLPGSGRRPGAQIIEPGCLPDRISCCR